MEKSSPNTFSCSFGNCFLAQIIFQQIERNLFKASLSDIWLSHCFWTSLRNFAREINKRLFSKRFEMGHVLDMARNFEGKFSKFIKKLNKDFQSSVGLGTGLHTFLLFLGPFIAKATIAGNIENICKNSTLAFVKIIL